MEKQKRRRPVPQGEAAPRHAESAKAPRARQRRRKRKLRLFYFLLFLIVLGSAAVLSFTVLFQINSIQVAGTSRYTQEEIIRASGITMGENLFLAKTKQAERAISQKLPYTGNVKVSRQLPAAISIQVEPATADGAVAYDGGYVLLTGSGKALELVEQPPEGCTVVSGLAVSSAVPGKPVVYEKDDSKTLYEQLVGCVKQHSLGPITKIDITDPYRILMEYDGRITMNLGSSADLDYKIRFGKTILEGKNESGEQNIRPEEKGVLNLSSAKEDDRAYFDPNGVISTAPPAAASSPPAPEASASTPADSTASSGGE